MKPRTIIQLNFYIMALIILGMLMYKLNHKGLPNNVHLILGIEKPAPTTVKATRGQ